MAVLFILLFGAVALGVVGWLLLAEARFQTIPEEKAFYSTYGTLVVAVAVVIAVWAFLAHLGIVPK